MLPNIERLEAAAAGPGTASEMLGQLFAVWARHVAPSRVSVLPKLMIAEAGNFPELARVWHDDLVAHILGALTDAIAAAQKRGEVKAGDPRMYALEIIAPMLLGLIWRETFVPVGAAPFDLPTLARQHVETMIEGLKPRIPQTGEAAA